MNERVSLSQKDVESNVLFDSVLSQVRDIPYATEESLKRRTEFEDWMMTHQDYLRDGFSELGIQSAPEKFIGIIHGSVARGHARETSDTDGTIFFDIQPARAEFGKTGDLEYLLPVDWGVRFINIATIETQLDEIDQEAQERSMFFDKERAFPRVVGPVSHLFGPGTSEEESGELLHAWRHRILTKISSLKHIYPDDLWHSIQEQWHLDFAVFDHRKDLIEVVNKSTQDEVVARELIVQRQSLNLPGIDELHNQL